MHVTITKDVEDMWLVCIVIPGQTHGPIAVKRFEAHMDALLFAYELSNIPVIIGDRSFKQGV
jgi:hypothetical protein